MCSRPRQTGTRSVPSNHVARPRLTRIGSQGRVCWLSGGPPCRWGPCGRSGVHPADGDPVGGQGDHPADGDPARLEM